MDKNSALRPVNRDDLEKYMSINVETNEPYWNEKPLVPKFETLLRSVQWSAAIIAFSALTSAIFSSLADYRSVCHNNTAFYCFLYSPLFPISEDLPLAGSTKTTAPENSAFNPRNVGVKH